MKDIKGYTTLLVVIVVSSIGLVISTTMLLLGVGSTRSMIAFENSNQSKSIANACAEKGLYKIREDMFFAGTEDIPFNGDNCSYTVYDQGGQSRRIDATGTANGTVRKVRVEVDNIIPNINITSWEELADF